jgi:hypothetical protein
MATIAKLEFDLTRGASPDVIRIADVHKYYDLGEAKVHALRGVSLDIRRGRDQISEGHDFSRAEQMLKLCHSKRP